MVSATPRSPYPRELEVWTLFHIWDYVCACHFYAPLLVANNKKDEDTLDDRGRDGGTSFILRIQGTGIKPNPSWTWWWSWYWLRKCMTVLDNAVIPSQSFNIGKWIDFNRWRYNRQAILSSCTFNFLYFHIPYMLVLSVYAVRNTRKYDPSLHSFKVAIVNGSHMFRVHKVAIMCGCVYVWVL